MWDHVCPGVSHLATSKAFLLSALQPRWVGVEAVCHAPGA
jgi:hypothetical protein